MAEPNGDKGFHFYGQLSMVRDFGQRHYEKIEAAVQISYDVSLAHRSKNRGHLSREHMRAR